MLAKERFIGLEGSHFTAVSRARHDASDESIGPVNLELVEVADRSTESLDAFTLLFLGPRVPAFAQGTVRLVHQALGSLDLFLVPILSPRADDAHICYQAIINRVRDAG